MKSQNIDHAIRCRQLAAEVGGFEKKHLEGAADEWERRATEAEGYAGSAELDFEADGIFTKVIAGLQIVAGFIATLAEDKRLQALEAAERSYFRTACDLGYDEEEAHRWAAVVMLHLRAEHREER